MKRVAALFLLVSMALLSACSAAKPSTPGTSSPGSSTAPAPAPAPAARITVAAVEGVESGTLKQVIADFESNGTKVELVQLPYNTLYEKVLNDVTSGTGAYDVVFMDDPWFPTFAGGGFLTPLKDFNYTADSDFAQSTLDVSSWPPPRGPRLPTDDPKAQPQLYALPLVGNVQLYFYRKDLVSKPPETWDDVKALAEKVTDKNKPFYGWVLRGARGNPIVTNFNPFLWSFGGDIFDDHWNVVVNSPQAVQALEFYVSLKQYSPAGVANFDADEVGNALLQGQAVGTLVWPAWASQMDDQSKSKVVGKIGYAMVPGKTRHAPQQGNWLLGIPKASKNKQAAFAFIKWATSKETMLKTTALGGVPTRKSVMEDPDLNKKYPFLAALAPSLQNAVWRPRTAEWAKVESILGDYLSKALTGQMTPQQALDGAAKDIKAHMEQAGYYKK